MNFNEAITKLNVLSSYDTTKQKREEYKECINVILEEHNKLKKYDETMYEPIQSLVRKLDALDKLTSNIKLVEYLVFNDRITIYLPKKYEYILKELNIEGGENNG